MSKYKNQHKSLELSNYLHPHMTYRRSIYQPHGVRLNLSVGFISVWNKSTSEALNASIELCLDVFF